MVEASGRGQPRARWTDLSVEHLRHEHPELLSRWVLIGVLAGIVGYTATTAIAALAHPPSVLLTRPEPWGLAFCLLALWPCLRGQTRLAGVLVLVPAWFEQILTLAVMPPSAWASATAALPVVVLMLGLWLGTRYAIAVGVLSIVAVPAAIAVSGAAGVGPGLMNAQAADMLVSLVVAIAVTLLLVTLFLRALGHMLARSEASEQRIRELFDDTPDAILALDAEDDVEEANPAAARLLQRRRDGLMGRALHELPLVPAEATWPEALEALHTGDGPVDFVVAGGGVLLEGVARERTRADGSRGVLLVLRDITARREAEREARTLQAQLQRAQRMEAVGILAGSVAHDFNNLLTAVGGYGALLGRNPDPNARTYANELMAMQERGAALVRQLLVFARRDAAHPRPFDIGEMLTELSPLVQRLAGEQVELVLEAQQDCWVHADPGQIEQVLLNLVANARDAMPDGGQLHIRCVQEDTRVRIEVQDAGEGISEEVRRRIFEPFFTTKAPGKGTGLGLSTAAGIIRESGGTIVAESAAGQGTRFILRLPSTERVSGSERTDRTSVRPSYTPGRHVVVAEDNDAVRSYLKMMLEREGFRVTATRSGDEASDTLGGMAKPPDLLLSDVVMPGRTGPQVAADARVRFPDLPVLFMSGYTGEAGRRGDFDPETDLIQKPFTDRELLRRIEDKIAGEVAEAG